MKRLITLLIALTLCIPTLSLGGAVSTIIGTSVDGPVPTYPVSLLVLCGPGGTEANCPKTFHPSWVDSRTFWGVNGAGNDTCVVSVDGGDTWNPCTVQPFAGTQTQIASTEDGSLVAVSSVAGTCTIKRSTDDAASWSTVYTDANQCNMSAGSSQLLKCQEVSNVGTGRCDYVFVLANTTTRIYTTTDNGASWTQSNTANINLGPVNSMYFDGTNGIASPTSGSNGRVTPHTTTGTWGVSSGWPAASGNYSCYGSGYFSAALVIFCYDNVALNYKKISSAGAVLTTFTPAGAVTASAGEINGIEVVSGSVSYFMGRTTAGGQAIWISIDNMSSFVLMYSNAFASGIATMFYTNGAVYISVAGTTGGFFKIS